MYMAAIITDSLNEDCLPELHALKLSLPTLDPDEDVVRVEPCLAQSSEDAVREQARGELSSCVLGRPGDDHGAGALA